MPSDDSVTAAADKPTFSAESVHRLLEAHYSLSGQAKPLPGEFDQNFLLTTDVGDRFIVKLLRGTEHRRRLEIQVAAMTHLVQAGFSVPAIVDNARSEPITHVQDENGEECLLRVLTFLPGHFFVDTPLATRGSALLTQLGEFLGRLDRELGSCSHLQSVNEPHKWDLAYGYTRCQFELHCLDREQSDLLWGFLEHYRVYVLPLLPALPRSLIHNDANDYNVLVDSASAPTQITGLIDFGDMVYSHTINELAIAAAYAIMGYADPIAALVDVVAGYHSARPLADAELEALFGLVTLRLCTSVCNAAAELQARPGNEYLQVSAVPAYELLQNLSSVSPFAVESRLRTACGMNPDRGRDKQGIIDVRKRHLGKTLSFCFDEPLKIVGGRGACLYDEQGNDYLDMVNNVCHVGHCHPRVVAAAQAQLGRLNTNTRFLHDNLVNYAERLLATMPEELSVCIFVNSGSEANELAFRLARNYTQSRQLIVVDGAYHGNTGACIDASPYKFDGPGGEGAPAHVHKVALPDPYRGEFKGIGRDAADGYARDVDRVLAALCDNDHEPGAFVCESLQGVAGQIIMPDGYLQAVYPRVRDAGGVCIADEVQVGFGRVGTHMWAFETQGVVPDIVTLGKPIGNGHPLAAVITTQAVADAFVTGMEYFNTFGGNPVSCAIGMAVLDVIQEEELQQNALETGRYLMDELRDLQQRTRLIGDVRGLGLFIGVELVEDRETLVPATGKTDQIVEYVKKQRVILSTEGPFHNVLKIKPPIVFNRGDADRFLAALQSAFKAIA